ncbi:MAG: hypothetical protein KF763_04400 [Cyclobacteriaceae bacterium]|nr:hypothetical protein [Cyclobacteriaceae bacterium]
MKITLVAGARPNFMKIAPIIRAMERTQTDGYDIHYRLVHTGQHYDDKLSKIFFEQLQIPAAHVNPYYWPVSSRPIVKCNLKFQACNYRDNVDTTICVRIDQINITKHGHIKTLKQSFIRFNLSLKMSNAI